MQYKRVRQLFLAGGVMLTVAIAGAEVGTFRESMETVDGRRMLYIGALGDMRFIAMDKPDRAVEMYFSPSAQSKWKLKVAREMESIMTADFFTGAIPLPGPQSVVESIAAFYNPWWDAMLLMRMRPVEATATSIAHVEVTEFHLLSGETFREEPPEKDDASIRITTVVPENDPISVEVWRSLSTVKKRFEVLFPLDGPVTYGAFASTLAMLDANLEMKRIIARGALRLKFAQMLLKNKKDAFTATTLANLVRTAGHYQLFTYFQDKECFKMLRTLSEMPDVFRKDFIPYGYVPTEAGTQYLFINRKVSRLYATAAVPAGVGKDKPASLEWFDLAQSDELLKTWESAKKEVSK